MAPISAMWNSMHVGSSNATRSPGATPSRARPPATAVARADHSPMLSRRGDPNARSATRPGLAAACARNAADSEG